MIKTTTQKPHLRQFKATRSQNFLPSYLSRIFLFALVLLLSSGGIPSWESNQGKNFKSWTWEAVNTDTPWTRRAGLQALDFKGDFYIMGGRTAIPGPPGNSIIWGDVWRSEDKGETWQNILPTNPGFPGPPTHWANRAYFQAVKKGEYMYVMGGQDYNLIQVPNPEYPNCPPPPPGAPPLPCEPVIQIPISNFFNDVWRSEDGVNWELLTLGIPQESIWSGRAGLSAAVLDDYIYVMGGSQNDDCSIIPGGCPPGAPPPRKYFNDVWRSRDGAEWELVTDEAPWKKRAGGIALVKDGYLYMIGGEEGFTCVDPSQPCPPYFNDVWRSKDGRDWELMTSDAKWPKRPGHQVVVAQDRMVLFGGFGLGDDNGVTPSNPRDVWVSNKGKVWKKVSDSPWNAEDSEQIKYDFDAVVVKGSKGTVDAIYTFGGDRETFDFSDETNFLRMDNDVWRFTYQKPDRGYSPEVLAETGHTREFNFPNPFVYSTSIVYNVKKKGLVTIGIFDRHGQVVRSFRFESMLPGEHECLWDGRKANGKPVKPGFYYARIVHDKTVTTVKLLKTG